MYDRWNSPYLLHHQVKGAKWGVRHGPPYPLGSDVSDGKKLIKNEDLSGRIYSKASGKEPFLTRTLTNAVNKTKGKLYGLDHRLKTQESIARKIDTDSLEKGISKSQAAKDLKDAVRYTVMADDKDFVKTYNDLKKDLYDQGFVEERCRNYFQLYAEGKAKHKSVQSVFRDPDGYLFEVQFQTPSSQKAKDLKVPIYEERRKPGLSKERQSELEAQMDELAKKVSAPRGIHTIVSHDNPENELGRNTYSYDYDKANSIYRTLSPKEKRFLMGKNANEAIPRVYVKKWEYDTKKTNNVFSRIEQYKDVPVSVIDIWGDGRGGADVSVAVRKDYQGKGYASRAVRDGIKYFYDNPELEFLVWGVNHKNRPSIDLAKKFGFELYNTYDDGWDTYLLEKKGNK